MAGNISDQTTVLSNLSAERNISAGTIIASTLSLVGTSSLGAIVGSSLSLTAGASLNTATLASTLSVGGAATLTSTASIGGALTQTGAATLASTLTVAGAATLTTSVQVGGASTTAITRIQKGTISVVAITVTATRSVTILGGRTTSLGVDLTVPSGQINIMTVPSGAEVAIDGRAMGTSPVRARLRVGQHTYTAKLPDRPPEAGTFTMENGRILTKKVIWDDEVAGIVEVRTIPPGATVSADGARISDRTPANFRLLAGRHTLIISLPGYADVQREIDVPADDSTPLKLYVILSQP